MEVAHHSGFEQDRRASAECQGPSILRAVLTTSNVYLDSTQTASLPAAAPSSTKMSQSADSRQPMHHAKPALAFRRPVVSPPSSKRVIFDRLASDDLVEDSDDFEEEVIEVNPPPPDRRLPSDELECDVCFKRVKCGVHDPRIRSGWTCLMCRWAKLKGKTAARVAASSSTTSATVPRPKAQPATFSKPKAVESASSAGKRPIVAGSTILGRAPRQVTSAPSSDSEISGGSEPSHLYITDDQLERSTPSEPTLTPRGPVLKPPGRRPRMTKQRREREFRQWFDTFLEDYTVKKAAGTTTPNAGSEYVEYLRTAGGTAYTTADEFFAALATHVRAHQRSLAEGKKGVMPKFFGAFSIVAQPRINYESRAEKVKDRLRGIGLIFDDDDPSVEGLYDTRHDSLGQVVRSRQWIYPCNCGGTVNPKPHPSLKALHNNPHPLTPCFGKIMLEVGDDHALQKYGIKGQHIALRIIH
ncbi:hypothetical protein FKP32DRAFT_1348061 [Trametes sanguinea]|nr:hypothetical protein FKP32DRAFT_1348061 [Trametes sanguinea]